MAALAATKWAITWGVWHPAWLIYTLQILILFPQLLEFPNLIWMREVVCWDVGLMLHFPSEHLVLVSESLDVISESAEAAGVLWSWEGGIQDLDERAFEPRLAGVHTESWKHLLLKLLIESYLYEMVAHWATDRASRGRTLRGQELISNLLWGIGPSVDSQWQCTIFYC